MKKLLTGLKIELTDKCLENFTIIVFVNPIGFLLLEVDIFKFKFSNDPF